MTQEKENQIRAVRVHGEIPLGKLIRQPKRAGSIYLLTVVEVLLLAGTVFIWHRGYLWLRAGGVSEYMWELRTAVYMFGLWMITSLAAGNGLSLMNLAVGRGSGNMIRKKHLVYFFQLEKCPLCGGKLELYRKGQQIMLCCQVNRDYQFYTEYEKIRELIK